MNKMTKDLNIGISFCIEKRLANGNADEKLVYYRRFPNAFDAAAHKYLLQNLSQQTVFHHIRSVNPDLQDLISELSIDSG